MALESATYQCPNCNGRLFYNGNLGMLQCEFCESTFTPEEIEARNAEKQAVNDAKAAGDRIAEAATAGAAAASTTTAAQAGSLNIESTGDPIQDYLNRAKAAGKEMEGMIAYNCPACGAGLMSDPTTAVTSCPYCGNNAVVPGQLSDVLKPDLIIPFKLDKKAAVKALSNHYNGKRFLPDSFTKNNHVEEVQGVYVPFWLYTGTASADVTFNARNVRMWSDAKHDYVETDHYILQRAGTLDFCQVPVDGSTKMPDAHMDAIEPYDYSELVPFSMGYLPGYLTERYDLDARKCADRASRRAENSTVDVMESTATGYMEIDVASSQAGVEWTQIAYALLPVWMLHTKWNNEDYLFAMNGQTGKFIGDLPIDKGKVRKRFLTIFLPMMVLLALIIYFVFGM